MVHAEAIESFSGDSQICGDQQHENPLPELGKLKIKLDFITSACGGGVDTERERECVCVSRLSNRGKAKVHSMCPRTFV